QARTKPHVFHGRTGVVEKVDRDGPEVGLGAIVVERGAESARARAGKHHLAHARERGHHPAQELAHVLVSDLHAPAETVARVAAEHVARAIGHEYLVPVFERVLGVVAVEYADGGGRACEGRQVGRAEAVPVRHVVAGGGVEAGAATLEPDHGLVGVAVQAHPDAGRRVIHAPAVWEIDPGPGHVGGRDRHAPAARRRRTDHAAPATARTTGAARAAYAARTARAGRAARAAGPAAATAAARQHCPRENPRNKRKSSLRTHLRSPPFSPPLGDGGTVACASARFKQNLALSVQVAAAAGARPDRAKALTRPGPRPGPHRGDRWPGCGRERRR